MLAAIQARISKHQAPIMSLAFPPRGNAEDPERMNPVIDFAPGLGDLEAFLDVRDGSPLIFDREAHAQKTQCVELGAKVALLAEPIETLLKIDRGAAVITGQRREQPRAVAGLRARRGVAQLICELTFLLHQAGSPGNIALHKGDPAENVERSKPKAVTPGASRESLVEPMPRLAEPTPHQPVTLRKRCGHLQANLGLARVGEAGLQRGTEVGDLAVHPLQPVHLPGADPVGVSLADELDVPVAVAAAEDRTLTRLPQLRPPEVPDQLQQPITSEVARRLPGPPTP